MFNIHSKCFPFICNFITSSKGHYYYSRHLSHKTASVNTDLVPFIFLTSTIYNASKVSTGKGNFYGTDGGIAFFPSFPFSFFSFLFFSLKNRAILTNVNPMEPVTTALSRKPIRRLPDRCRKGVLSTCTFVGDQWAGNRAVTLTMPQRKGTRGIHIPGLENRVRCERPENANERFDTVINHVPSRLDSVQHAYIHFW